MKQSVLAATLVACGWLAQAQTITVVTHAGLRMLDPIMTTAHIVRDHGYMVYDTLLAPDAQGAIQPQMVQGWEVSDDGRSYTFTLRDGLKWHDGSAVSAEDCVASIQRWATQDKMGQMLVSDPIGSGSFKMVMSEYRPGVQVKILDPQGYQTHYAHESPASALE